MLCDVASIKAVGGVGDRETRVRTLGLLAVAYSVMQFVSPLLIGFAYDHSGPRAAFLVLSALPMLGLIGLLTGRHLYVTSVARFRTRCRREVAWTSFPTACCGAGR